MTPSSLPSDGVSTRPRTVQWPAWWIVEPIPVGTGTRLGVERGAQVLGLDQLLDGVQRRPAPIRLGVGDGGQPGRCQSPSRGQPLDALLVCFEPAAATLSRGN